MSLHQPRILESKRARRRQLAARPVAEKLLILDALQERALTLRAAPTPSQADTDALREEPATYRTKPA